MVSAAGRRRPDGALIFFLSFLLVLFCQPSKEESEGGNKIHTHTHTFVQGLEERQWSSLQIRDKRLKETRESSNNEGKLLVSKVEASV